MDQHGLRLDSALAPAALTGEHKLIDSLITNLIENAIRHNVRGGRWDTAAWVVDRRGRVPGVHAGPAW